MQKNICSHKKTTFELRCIPNQFLVSKGILKMYGFVNRIIDKNIFMEFR